VAVFCCFVFYCFVILLFFLLWRFFCFFVIYCFVVIVLYLLFCVLLLFCICCFVILLFCYSIVFLLWRYFIVLYYFSGKIPLFKATGNKVSSKSNLFLHALSEKALHVVACYQSFVKRHCLLRFRNAVLRFVTVGFQRFFCTLRFHASLCRRLALISQSVYIAWRLKVWRFCRTHSSSIPRRCVSGT